MAKIQDILTMQKRELEKALRANYVRRDIQLPAADKDIIKVIIGPRRSGKSFFTGLYFMTGNKNIFSIPFHCLIRYLK